MFKKIRSLFKKFAFNIKLYVFFTLLLTFSVCHADFFSDYDHQINHFTAGFTVGTITFKTMDSLFYTEYKTNFSDFYLDDRYRFKMTKNKDVWYYAIPMAAVVVAGVIKENADGYWDWEQFGWTCIGGICAITLMSW